MAGLRSEIEREDLRRRFNASKEKAIRLLEHTDALADEVFSSLNKLHAFLDLTARLHHYNGYNLLLIWKSYPSATYLAGYKVWERKLPSGAQILKKEHFGKGIDLVAPFTESVNGQSYLVWYTLSVFDISQTNCKLYPPAFDGTYIHDNDHLYFLLDAVKMALGTKFERSVSVQPPSQLMQEVGLPGQITQRSVVARDDLPPEELLQWLTEALALLNIEGFEFNVPTTQLLKDCIRYCLFRIWGLDEFASPPSSSVQLRSVSPHGLSFIHLLRDSVRELNNLISGLYTVRRDEDDDLLDLDPEDLLDYRKAET